MGIKEKNQHEIIDKIVCQEQEIEIVNDDSNTVAKIKIEALGNGGIVFVDNNAGNDAACITVNEERCSVHVYSKSGRRELGISTDDGDGGGMVIRNKEGIPVVFMNHQNNGGVGIRNKAGKIAAIFAGKTGATVLVYNNADKPVATIITTENGGIVRINNKAGKLVAGIAADENGVDDLNSKLNAAIFGFDAERLDADVGMWWQTKF